MCERFGTLPNCPVLLLGTMHCSVSVTFPALEE